MRLIVLAAGRGSRLGSLTDDRPKGLVELAGRTLLERQLEAARAAGVDDVVIVGGHRAEQLERLGHPVVCNPDHATTNMAASLFCAQGHFADGFVMSYGDIVYRPAVLASLLDDQSPVAVVVDLDWRSYWSRRFDDPLDDAESLRIDDAGLIRSIGQRVADVEEIDGQYVGLAAFRGIGVAQLQDTWRRIDPLRRDGLFMTDLLQRMIDEGYHVHAVPIRGDWLEIDTPHDLALAEREIARP